MRHNPNAVQRIGAVVALVGLVVGVPWALVRWGRLDVVRTLHWRDLLVAPDGGALLLLALTLAAWIAWLSVVVCLTTEAIDRLSRGRRRLRPPGTNWFRPVAGLLITGVLGLGLTAVTPALANASPPDAAPRVGVATTASGTSHGEPTGAVDPAARVTARPVDAMSALGAVPTPVVTESAPSPVAGSSAPTGHLAPEPVTHRTRSGDDLWSLAQRYLGDGAAWRRIVAANASLALDPTTDLPAGLDLIIPVDVAAAGRTGVFAPGTAAPDAQSVPQAAAGRLGAQPTSAGPGDGPSAQPVFDRAADATDPRPSSAPPTVMPSAPTAPVGATDPTDAPPSFPAPSAARDAAPASATSVPTEAAEAPTAPITPSTITVRPGDTLWDLSRAHLGRATAWPSLYEANRDVIADPDLIRPGWRLRLPQADLAEATATVPDGQPSTPADDPAPAEPTTPSASPSGVPVPVLPDADSGGGVPGAPASGPGETAHAPSGPALVPDDPPATGAPATTPAGETADPSPDALPTTDDAPPTDATPAPGREMERVARGSGDEVPPDAARAEERALVRETIGPVGITLADLLLAGVTLRRQLALRHRPLGRRLRPLPEATARFEAALARQGSYGTPVLVGAPGSREADDLPGAALDRRPGEAPGATGGPRPGPDGGSPGLARPFAEPGATPSGADRWSAGLSDRGPARDDPATGVGGVLDPREERAHADRAQAPSGASLAGAPADGSTSQTAGGWTLGTAWRPAEAGRGGDGPDAGILSLLREPLAPSLTVSPPGRSNEVTTSSDTPRLPVILYPDATVPDGGATGDGGDGGVSPVWVHLGLTPEGPAVPCDLDKAGLVRIVAPEPLARGVVAAIACELVMGDAATRPETVLVGDSFGWLAGLSRGEAELLPDVEAGLLALGQELRQRQRYLARPSGSLTTGDATVGQETRPAPSSVPSGETGAMRSRIESYLVTGPSETLAATAAAEADEESPTVADLPRTVFCFDQTVDTARAETLAACGLSVVMPATAPAPGSWSVLVDEDGVAHLPAGNAGFLPQTLTTTAQAHLARLTEAAAGDLTDPAPWWRTPVPDHSLGAARPPDKFIGPPSARPLIEAALIAPSADARRQDAATAPAVSSATHPRLLVLGSIELDGACGPAPDRAARACAESLGWLLRHPGSTATQMTRDLLVAEGTRRSNLSRLRTWLGRLPDGSMYLPDAYSGRMRVDRRVHCDWDEFMIIVTPGVNRSGDKALQQALGLVRGAPLADAVPGQWHWAEGWRLDMVSAIRDAGAVLAQRALDRHDLDLARWACGRALLAAPEDDLLMMLRLRTESQAHNHAEVQRLAAHVVAQARDCGVDLSDDMVKVLQEVSEASARTLSL